MPDVPVKVIFVAYAQGHRLRSDDHSSPDRASDRVCTLVIHKPPQMGRTWCVTGARFGSRL